MKGDKEVEFREIINGDTIADRISYLDDEAAYYADEHDLPPFDPSGEYVGKEYNGYFGRISAIEVEKKIAAWEEWEYAEERVMLFQIEEQVYGDLRNSRLVSDTYFKDFARELVEDWGYTSNLPSWLHPYLDWDGIADEIRQDFYDIQVDSWTYWVEEY